MEHEGKWGFICPSAWTPANSFVICGQLGFPQAKEAGPYTLTEQDVEPFYWLDSVSCRGWESSIVSCDHAGWGSTECEGGRVLRITCERRRFDKVSRCNVQTNMCRLGLYRLCPTTSWKKV